MGAGLSLLATSRPWVTARLDDAVLGPISVVASGRQAAALVPALALVALAGGVALLLARRTGRRAAGLLLVLAGAGTSSAAVSLLRSPQSGVRDLVGRAVGTVGAPDAATTLTGWPWLAVAGGVLVAAGGVLAVLRAGRWQGPRSRYDSPAPGTHPTSTAGPAGAAGAAAATDSPTDPDPGAVWDALSRGEDPTAPRGTDLPQ